MRLVRLECLASFWWVEIGLKIAVQEITRISTQGCARARQGAKPDAFDLF